MVLQHREECKLFFIMYGTEVLNKDNFFVGLCLWGGEWKQRRRVENSFDSKEHVELFSNGGDADHSASFKQTMAS